MLERREKEKLVFNCGGYLENLIISGLKTNQKVENLEFLSVI